MQKVAISGYTGFIGRRLAAFLRDAGMNVVSIPRYLLTGGDEDLAGMLEGTDVVVHLAGAPVIGRWTKKYRRQIYDSRINTTRKLVSAMELMNKKPSVFISASAVGIYPDHGTHTETSEQFAAGFLGKVCADWEYEASKAAGFVRTLMFRNGIVLGRNGGALQKMLLPFRLGLGGKVASGKQMMSWIHMDDLLRAVLFSINNPVLNGPVNLSSPHPVSNAVFTRTLARTLRRPAFMPVPAFALKLLYGEGATALTRGQTALPEKLLQAGFRFRFPKLEEAMAGLLTNKR